MENEMIERVTRAILAEMGEYEEMEIHGAIARAAIAAMRVPTEAMIAAGFDAAPATPDFYWQTMIDAALKSG